MHVCLPYSNTSTNKVIKCNPKNECKVLEKLNINKKYRMKKIVLTSQTLILQSGVIFGEGVFLAQGCPRIHTDTVTIGC